jgi:uncharacterized SAM-binding protein YcdF (DUF218 family)
MSALISLAKAIGGPGSGGFFLVCSAAAGAMLFIGPRSRRAAKALLAVVIIFYGISALPPISLATAAPLAEYAPSWHADGQGSADVLVVLSGDNPRGRARETRRILDIVTPKCVVIAGSPWFVRFVVRAGVPTDRFSVDNSTSTTREQVSKLRLWAEQCGAQRIVLVASAVSMRRVDALARTTGLTVVLAPAPLDEDPPTSGWRARLPSLAALRLTRDAIYEHAALAYYHRRGWIR